MTARIITMLATASIVALAAPALAQDAAGQASKASVRDANARPNIVGPEEIIVTAQRRRERVTQVPISITVATQAQLERQQVNTINDLSRISPSLEIQSAPRQNVGGGGGIRGIGTQSFNLAATASVGIVVDQVSQGNANISDLFDVSRIEVLKGPQGTLFGLTTSAGVIDITTNAPDPTKFEGRIRTELSSSGFAGSEFGDQIVQGYLNLPLSTDAALRVSGNANLRQGPGRNLTAHGLTNINRYGSRARLLWQPDRRFTINLIGDYARGRTTNGGDSNTIVKASGPGEVLNFGFAPMAIWDGITASPIDSSSAPTPPPIASARNMMSAQGPWPM